MTSLNLIVEKTKEEVEDEIKQFMIKNRTTKFIATLYLLNEYNLAGLRWKNKKKFCFYITNDPQDLAVRFSYFTTSSFTRNLTYYGFKMEKGEICHKIFEFDGQNLKQLRKLKSSNKRIKYRTSGEQQEIDDLKKQLQECNQKLNNSYQIVGKMQIELQSLKEELRLARMKPNENEMKGI